MSEKFKLEDRYLVLKISDAIAALAEEDQEALRLLELKVNLHRNNLGKPMLKALVIEKDWPEYVPALEMLEKRVNSEPLTSDKLTEKLKERLKENIHKIEIELQHPSLSGLMYILNIGNPREILAVVYKTDPELVSKAYYLMREKHKLIEALEELE